MSRIIFFIIVSTICGDCWAQQCDLSRPLSTPTDNFFDNHDGTVTELETGLTWMRCAIGQTWNGKDCEGEARRFSWKEALLVADKQTSSNWRTPSLAELATIVERQCKHPRINSALFPNTPRAAFWTANMKKGRMDKAYAMDFANEGVLVVDRTQALFLRLVYGRE